MLTPFLSIKYSHLPTVSKVHAVLLSPVKRRLLGFAHVCTAPVEKGAIFTGMRHDHVSRSATADLRRGHRYREPDARAPGKIGVAGRSYNQRGNAEPFYAELILPLLCRRRRSPNARLDGEQPDRAPAGPGVGICADEDERERPRLLFQVLYVVDVVLDPLLPKPPFQFFRRATTRLTELLLGLIRIIRPTDRDKFSTYFRTSSSIGWLHMKAYGSGGSCTACRFNALRCA